MVQQAKTTNKARTWATVAYDCMDGAVVQIRRNTVTLSADAEGMLSAQVDGESAALERAVRLLTYADHTELLSELRLVPVPPMGGAA